MKRNDTAVSKRNKKLLEILERFPGKRIAVLGDLMLDSYIWGDTERISPEAPVPVVLASRESMMPGGAGNTASNVAALRGVCEMYGLVGEDQAGEELLAALELEGIGAETGWVFRRPGSTIQKMRIIARGQHMVRIDREDGTPLPRPLESAALKRLSAAFPKLDGVVVSDYAKGFVTKRIMQEVVRLASKAGKPVVVDGKPQHLAFYKGVTVFTPNTREALEAARVSSLERAGALLQKRLRSTILVTRGGEGMSLFSQGKKPYHIPAKPRQVFDVSGAGDTVVAVVALALAAGASEREAAELANEAGGIAVGKVGAAPVSLEELEEAIRNAR